MYEDVLINQKCSSLSEMVLIMFSIYVILVGKKALRGEKIKCSQLFKTLLWLIYLTQRDLESNHVCEQLELQNHATYLIYLGYFTLWSYRPNLAELKSVPYCYNDLIIILVTLIISFAIKLIKQITTKLPIAARYDWRHCHRKIVKSGLKFSQKNFIRKFGIQKVTIKHI